MDRNKLIELLKYAWNDGNSQYHDCKHNWEYKQDLQNWFDNYEDDINEHKQDLQNWFDNYDDDINELCEGNPANSENANCAIFGVSGSLPLDDEDVLEPIQNALYATHAFSLDDCTGLASGILSYLKEAGFAIVRGNDR